MASTSTTHSNSTVTNSVWLIRYLFAFVVLILFNIVFLSVVYPRHFLLNKNLFVTNFQTTKRSEAYNNLSIYEYLSLWEKSWTNYSILSTSPLGDILPHVVNGLKEYQNVADCSKASFLFWDYTTSLGFGAYIKHLLVIFHLAINSNRILVIDHKSKWRWMEGCQNSSNNGRFECMFLPLSSTCTFEKVNSLIKSGKLSISDLPRSQTKVPYASATKPDVIRISVRRNPKFGEIIRNFARSTDFSTQITRLTAKTNISSFTIDLRTKPERNAKRIWQTCLVWYVLRFNAHTASRVSSQIRTSLLAVGAPSPRRLLGMPFRSSDKCIGAIAGNPGEMNCVSLKEAVESAHRIAFGLPHITHLIVTSEVADAISVKNIRDAQEAVSFNPPLRIVRNINDLPPGSGSISRNKSDKNNAQLLEAFLVSAHLQALAMHHVMTPRSTAHSLIAALAMTTPGKREWFMFPLGRGDDLKASLRSQIV